MRFRKQLLVAVALAAATPAFGQAPYVDPALRALLEPRMQAALRRAPALGPQVEPERQPLAAGVAVRKMNVLDVPRVALFAEIRSEQAIATLNALGARIGSRVGNIVTAEVPLDSLAKVLASPHFEVLEAARAVTITNDSSMRVIGADMVRRAANGSWSGTAGRGVIVGVYDTGIDFLHEDFIDGSGQTRLLGLWDQTAQTGSPPSGFGYGRYCSRDAIQQVVQDPASTACPQLDLNGHGSHVAGTAAGDGSAVGVNGGTPFVYAGVAPLADIMVVKGGNGLFSEASIIDGLVWLEQQARALNKPMVVNLSLGGQAGPHDGTRLYEAIVDALARGGFIAVFSAGNDGNNNTDRNPNGTEPERNPFLFHGQGLPGSSRDFTIDVAPYTAASGTCNDFMNLGLWYEATDRLDISVLRPDGGLVNAPFGQVREQDSPVGNVRIDNGSPGPNPRNNAYEAAIAINDCGSGAAPVAGTWTLRVSPVSSVSGKPYHFWLYAQALGGGTVARGRQGFDNHYVVSSPGNARSAITVGAFVTKLCWTSPAKPEGPVCFVTQEPLGELARFSSGGPTRDGRLKPEITAPGLAIASAKSRNALVAANRILNDGVHWTNQGTSMAAPHVTGAIALMLENQPTLSAADVRDIFSRTASRDAFTSRVYDNSFDANPAFWWGFGKLNVCAALGAAGGGDGSGIGPVVITPVADTIPINATTRFFSCSPTGASIAFQSTNPAVATIDAQGNVFTRQRGTTLLIATSGTYADTAELVVTDPASLRVSLRDLAPDTATLAPRGTLLPLLSTVLRVNGYEGMRVIQLTYRLTGRDPGARIVLIADANRNGVIDVGERTVGSRAIALNGVPVNVAVALDSVIVAQRDSVNLIAALELSGAAPNGSSFSAEFVANDALTLGLRSSARDRIEAVANVASSAAVTSVLPAGQTFSLSENPVRSGRVVFNFADAPRLAGIYTLTGRRVADLKARMSTDRSITWDLTNDDGARVATGAYFAVFDFGSGVVREKLFILPTSMVAQ